MAALAIEALLLLALLSLGLSVEKPPEAQLTEVSLSARDVDEAEQPEPEQAPPPASEQVAPSPLETSAPVAVPTPVPAVIPLPTAPQAPQPAESPAPSVPTDETVYGPPDTGRPRSGDSERVGTAPDGSPLYAAQWYREPGREFFGFFSAASEGSGLMACRTIPNFYGGVEPVVGRDHPRLRVVVYRVIRPCVPGYEGWQVLEGDVPPRPLDFFRGQQR